MVPILIVLYGGELDKNGRLNADAASRCDTAIAEARRVRDAVIVFTVGIPKKYPTLRKVTLAYLKDHGWPPNKIIGNAMAVDTLGETEWALRIVRRYGNDAVIVVSSGYHMDRIHAMWDYFRFNGRVVSCPSPVVERPFYRWLYERGAFLKFRWRTFGRKPKIPAFV